MFGFIIVRYGRVADSYKVPGRVEDCRRKVQDGGYIKKGDEVSTITPAIEETEVTGSSIVHSAQDSS